MWDFFVQVNASLRIANLAISVDVRCEFKLNDNIVQISFY